MVRVLAPHAAQRVRVNYAPLRKDKTYWPEAPIVIGYRGAAGDNFDSIANDSISSRRNTIERSFHLGAGTCKVDDKVGVLYSNCNLESDRLIKFYPIVVHVVDKGIGAIGDFLQFLGQDSLIS